MMKKLRVTLVTPTIAWPTVVLAVLTFSAWIWSFMYLKNTKRVLVSTLATYIAFTPAHDAAHRSVSRNYRVLNEAVGWLSQIPLLAPFPAFRFCHLEHHKNVNDPDRDPDFYSQRSGLFFRWCTQDLHYYYLILTTPSKKCPKYCIPISIAILFAQFFTLFLIAQSSGFNTILQGWILPQRLAVIMLAYSFDFVPHRGAEPRKLDEYRTTKHIQSSWLPAWLLRCILLCQDAHVVHHLYPLLPFYSYHRIWFNHSDELYARGVQDTTLF
uniref:Fatty acid desaturase domain-containing protein n=1 Tax=Aureoumbra lagunensis TaxID=44058 RepID=A0A7S3NH38_9STRA|mmetsp:Transcript_21016/g.32224  ORF Transcript_21016/g.32224 Transcript_21016/m.32224 type:complete len:269 (+) Transcript_21016:47-853(+)